LALISKGEAAKRLGRDPAKITKLIKDGKLRTYKPQGQREQVDEEEVERVRIELELGAKFTPNGMRPIEPGDPDAEASARAEVPANKKKIADLTEEDFDLFDTRGRLDAVACRAWGEFEKSRKLNIERLALEGEYVLAAEVGPRFERAMLTIQKGVLATPSRLKALEPEISQSILNSLERLLREALEKAVDDSINGN
jgi:excisionase family DNA binding protein